MKIYNTLSRSIEEFVPIHPTTVGMYSCGPTVYDYQHVGHMRRYVGDDVLLRVLRANGYVVHHVMNITDVGHLVSDEDTGEDKMEKGAKKYGKDVWELAKMFEQQFTQSCKALGITLPTDLMHATDFIPEQITLIKKLEEKGFTYKIEDGIYFDTSKFPDYFKLSRQNPEELKKGARVEFVKDKKNVSDFALWKFSPTNEKRQMEWESPWGVGFPGWHIECSAMSMKALGNHFDIHTGGIDHINIHHTNEIAQSEAVTGEKFVNYWVHHNFLVVNGEKMSKSLGNFYTVQDLIKDGYDPLALRYLILQTHYRQEMNFTLDSLKAAEVALMKLRSHMGEEEHSIPNLVWMEKFMDALNDDLNTAKALAVVWEMVKDDALILGEKKATLLEMDKILGLDLDKKTTVEVPQAVVDLVSQREAFRKAGDWGASDEMRSKIQDLGWEVEDSKNGTKVTPKK
ncbi:MAG TPA: cysteine--tRNA ligase [Patescibacteria group bacterium]|nr:cysteine--tRNA ligase [Patescibacteria group bacterium]